MPRRPLSRHYHHPYALVDLGCDVGRREEGGAGSLGVGVPHSGQKAVSHACLGSEVSRLSYWREAEVGRSQQVWKWRRGRRPLAFEASQARDCRPTSRSRPSTLPHFSCSRAMGPEHPLHILNGHPSPLASPACSSVHPPLTSTLPRRLGGALAPACCCGQPPGCSARPRPGRHVSGRCADGGLKQPPR